jgi:cytoskeletal protein CcmA (bactofilin family)
MSDSKLVANNSNDLYMVKTPKNGSVINKCMTIEGKINSCDDLIVEGKVKADITSLGILIIAKDGLVIGNIKAKEVRIEGTLIGEIQSNKVEITTNAKTTGLIKASICKSDGYSKGDIICEDEIELKQNSTISALEISAKKIKIAGSCESKIISKELLEILDSAKIKGDLFVNLISIEPKAKIEGSIGKYKKQEIKKIDTNKNIKQFTQKKTKPKKNIKREIKVIKPKKRGSA